MAAGIARLKLDERADETAEDFEYSQTWEVFTSDPADDANTVLAAPGLPLYGDAFPSDNGSRVSSRQPRRMDDLYHWQIDVQYKRQKQSDEEKQNPPTLRPVRRSASTRWVERALFKDRAGKIIATDGTNTPFNPPITVAVPHPVVTFTRWESSFSTSIQKAYCGKVNSTAFGAYDTGTVMCTDISASEEWEQNAFGQLQRYWQVTYEFEAAPHGDWDKYEPTYILNQDVFHMNPSGTKRLATYIDSAGSLGASDDLLADAIPVPYPVPIYENGLIIDIADLPDAAHFIEFHIYEPADFNALNLPVN